MITLTSTSSDLIVSQSGSDNYYPNNQNPLDGYVRVNGTNMEYWNGSINCWMPVHGTDLNISINPTITDWIYKKMAEEAEILELEKHSPQLKKAREHYNTILDLTKEHNND
jgi:hypothetical protein